MAVDRQVPAADVSVLDSGIASAWARLSGGSSTIRLLFAGVLSIVAWIVAAPALMLIFSSFTAGRGKLPLEATDLTLANYIHVLTDATTYHELLVDHRDLHRRLDRDRHQRCHPLRLAHRAHEPLAAQGLLRRNPYSDGDTQHAIYAMAWIQLLNSNNGALNLTLGRMGLGVLRLDIFSMPGMIFLQGITLASHGYLLIAVCFRTLDASWEEQSYVAGRRLWGTMLNVTLPMLKPALLAATLFFAIVAMETFDIPVTLGDDIARACAQHANLLEHAS